MSYDPNEDHRPGELFQCYRKGWIAAARGGAMDPKFTKHEDVDFAAEYERGFTDGYTTNREAMAKAAVRLGYKSRIIRTVGAAS